MSVCLFDENGLTGKSKCIRCLKEISTKEFLENDHRCKKCNKFPNSVEEKRCINCKHYPHKTECTQPIFKDSDEKCGCMKVTI